MQGSGLYFFSLVFSERSSDGITQNVKIFSVLEVVRLALHQID